MSKPAAKSLPTVYFRCERLNARMSVSSCVAQYGAANGHGDQHGMRFVQKAHRSQCVECPIGKGHRKGESTPAELVIAPPVAVDTTPPPKARVCQRCLSPFVNSSNGSTRVCDGCVDSALRAAAPATGTPPPPAKQTSRAPSAATKETSDMGKVIPVNGKTCKKCGDVFVPDGPAGLYCVRHRPVKGSGVKRAKAANKATKKAATKPSAVAAKVKLPKGVKPKTTPMQALRDAFVVRATPGDVLKAAGYEVVSEHATPAGTMLVIRAA